MPDEGRAPSSLLAPDEVELLCRALLEWSGPARCSDQLAAGMGFGNARDLVVQSRQLRDALARDVPLGPADWARTLLAVEIVFVSDLAGSGTEWRTTTGFPDEETVVKIRSIQRKLARTVRSYYGKTPA
ncbi:hypothetical protein [Streptomyces sp. NPDC093260]|uniref:hypothetical protein n=1 Tax=Streptomyces sp. NPDC093260 TaxID=3155073 RepID=UPI003427F197